MPRPATLALKMIEAAEEGVPADRALREGFRDWKNYPADDRREAARRVFSYFRWRGWLDPDTGLATRVDDALRWAALWARDPGKIPARDLAERAVPRWIHEELSATPGWLASLQNEPTVWIRARREHMANVQASLSLTPTPGIPGAFKYEGDADLFVSPEFQSGQIELQDISSQWVGQLADPGPGETWWDACAGEGGKTLHLSDLMTNRGLIWASDRSKRRLDVLRKRAGRAQCFNYRAVDWDGSEKLPTGTRFDGVLVDAPCSGVGTWGRNPHSRWTLTPGDVAELAGIQSSLLRHAARAVKPGGRLVYAVCTLTRRETTLVAQAFDAAHPDFTREPMRQPGEGSSGMASEVWIHPPAWNSNGMYLAAWRRMKPGTAATV